MIELLYYLMVALGINLLMFIPGYLFRTDKLTDLSYSLTFIILTLCSLVLSDKSSSKLILSAMILVWALRLGIFLFIRIRKIKYDKRFDGIRESFSKFSKFWILQGLAVWIILIPTLFFMNSTSTSVMWMGLLIWILGFTIESIADFQKYRFSQDEKNKHKFIITGLWKYSRHPNYFGEILCWIGIYLFAFFSLSAYQQVIALASPLFIIILLLFVTGLPPLEISADLKWGKQTEYKNYKKNTNILIPWIPKK